MFVEITCTINNHFYNELGSQVTNYVFEAMKNPLMEDLVQPSYKHCFAKLSIVGEGIDFEGGRCMQLQKCGLSDSV